MKKADIKPGRYYVIRPQGAKRAHVIEGMHGQVVKVMGVGTYTKVRGECGSWVVQPTDQRSDIRVWIRGKQPKSRYDDTLVTFDELVIAGDILLTKKEWELKNAAWLTESRRIQKAIADHAKAIKAEARIVEAVTGGSIGLGSRRAWNAKKQRYGVTSRVVTISIPVPALRRRLIAAGNAAALEALNRYIALSEKPRSEVTC